MARLMILNPQLEGEPFFWMGGPVGILLIHGYTATTAEVRLLGHILQDQGYTVAAPLLPGHYSTPEELNRVHWQDWLVTAEKMYQKLAIECQSVFVGGESTGGLLALYLASEYPEIMGILTYAPALRLSISRYDTIRLHLSAPFVPYLYKENKNNDLPWQGYTVYPLKGALQLLKLQKAVKNRLAGIRQPILIVQGRQDTTVHPDVPQMIYQNVNSSVKEIHWMEKSTHVVLVDCEHERAGKITLDFINRALEVQKQMY